MTLSFQFAMEDLQNLRKNGFENSDHNLGFITTVFRDNPEDFSLLPEEDKVFYFECMLKVLKL